MARKTLKDDEGNEYDVELPDDTADDDDDEDEETVYLDAEDIEWLKRKRLEESEQSRRTSSSKQTTAKKPASSGKVVKIRAKQTASTSTTGRKDRKRVLRLA